MYQFQNATDTEVVKTFCIWPYRKVCRRDWQTVLAGLFHDKYTLHVSVERGRKRTEQCKEKTENSPTALDISTHKRHEQEAGLKLAFV